MHPALTSCVWGKLSCPSRGMGYPIVIRELAIILFAAAAAFLLLALAFRKAESQQQKARSPLIEMGSTDIEADGPPPSSQGETGPGSTSDENSGIAETKTEPLDLSRHGRGASVSCDNSLPDTSRDLDKRRRFVRVSCKRETPPTNIAEANSQDPEVSGIPVQLPPDYDETRSTLTFCLLDLRGHIILLWGSVLTVGASYGLYVPIRRLHNINAAKAVILAGFSGMLLFIISALGLCLLNNKGYGNILREIVLEWWPCSTVARGLRKKCEAAVSSESARLGSLRPKDETSVDVQFRDLCLRLRSGKVLLDRVDGQFNSSSVNAIMGPSGEPLDD